MPVAYRTILRISSPLPISNAPPASVISEAPVLPPVFGNSLASAFGAGAGAAFASAFGASAFGTAPAAAACWISCSHSAASSGFMVMLLPSTSMSSVSEAYWASPWAFCRLPVLAVCRTAVHRLTLSSPVFSTENSVSTAPFPYRQRQ